MKIKIFTLFLLIFFVAQLNAQVQNILKNVERSEGDNHFLRWHKHVDEVLPMVHNTEKQSALNSHAVLTQVDTSSGCPTDWTPAVQLSVNCGSLPSIATQGDQYLHVTWSSADSARLRYARSTDGGLTFEIRDLTDWTMFPEGVVSVKVLATEKYVYLFFIAFRGGGGASPIYLMKSTDNGETFEAPRITVDKIISSYEFDRDDEVALGDTIIIYESRNRHIFYSTDAGVNWHFRRFRVLNLWNPRMVYPHLALSSGTLHLTYIKYGRRYRGGEIFYIRSTNLSKRWSRPVLLTTPDRYPSFEPYDISATKNGELHIAWRDGKYGSWNGRCGSLIYRKSGNNGLTFGPEVVLTQIPEAMPGFPPIHVEPNFGNPVAVAWHVDTLSSGSLPPFNFQVKTRTSLDGGYSWCPEVNLTPEAESAAHPAVHVSPSRVFVAWQKYENWNYNIFIRSAPVKVNPIVRENNPAPPQLNQEPLEFGLMQNYPNPFNPTTTISFILRNTSLVTLKIFNVLGQEVAALLNKDEINSGRHDIEFNADKLASGIYFYHITVEERLDNGAVGSGFTKIHKMSLLK